MGFFGFSPSLKAKEQMWYSKNRGQSYLESIFDSVSNVHLILWQWHLDTKSCGYLSSSAFIWKASSSQSSSLWVNSLTSCCWAEYNHTNNYGGAFRTGGSQSQTTSLNCTYEQESVKSMPCLASAELWRRSSLIAQLQMEPGCHEASLSLSDINASYWFRSMPIQHD